MNEPLLRYREKRRFDATPEPRGARARRGAAALHFVVQRHDARRLHYDFRLELDGVLLSWAVPKGPSLDPAVKRLAVHVEDHPLEYGSFEGRIPEGNYGAGTVEIWDQGTWQPEGGLRGAREGLKAGKLKFTLNGEKLHGGWALVRSQMDGGKQEQWLLIKERDTEARNDEVEPAKKTKKKKAGAARTPLPETLAPELATAATAPPGINGWLYELKFDGYRVLSRIERHAGKTSVRIVTRAGHDWTAKFSRAAKALGGLEVESAWLDGEAVVLDAHGVPSFQALQSAFDAGRADDIVFYLFDLPWLDGEDLRGVPLDARRARLSALLEHADPDALRFSAEVEGDPGALLEAACEAGLEGLVAKRRDSLYTSTRSTAWLKLRCARRQEFVIGGYTDPEGSRVGFGALLLGVYEGGALRYAGRVGTGFNERLLKSLAGELARRERKTAAFVPVPRETGRMRGGGRVHWVRPDLVAEVNFKSWTSDGLVRQASFAGLRRDKPAEEIVRESQASREENGVASGTGSAPAKKAAAGSRGASRTGKRASAQDAEVSGIRITHPDRVIDESTGTRKIDLVRYFEAVAPWLLPQLHRRPVALARAPDGIGGELFFQKHATRLQIPHAVQHGGLDPGHEPLLTLDDLAGLIGAAQMDTIELHTWNATVDNIEKPDRIVFDLDPDPALGWDRMIEAARLTHDLLEELGLAAWCKTSGGKGLHVVVPLARRASWDEAKSFAQAVAAHMAATLPDRYSAKMGPQNRKGKIFIDYLRNGRGASTAAAYAPRARPGMGVSVPIGWDELESTTGGAQWTVANLHERLDALRGDPWAGYGEARQRITETMRRRLAGM
jgi:bifunctional non-homologous end joining protein LigD